MKKWLKIVFFISALLILSFFLAKFISAQSCDSPCPAGDTSCPSRRIADCESKINTLQGQANTLSNQIAQFNAQIYLTALKIQQTEDKIALLGGRIDQLEVSLNDLTKAFSSRAVETYKMSRIEDPFMILISATDLSDAVSRFHYLQKIQEADRDLLNRLQTAQTNYKSQKSDQEELQKQLAQQKINLDNQKAAKAQLLAITRNSEAQYQQLLAQARAELEAIQSIIAGQGEETPAGDIGEGQRIASIRMGSSPCSSGTHLHFEVVQNGAHQNPANFLLPKEVIWDDGPDGPFNFSGNWQWPVNDPIRITQGYGMTYYASVLKYYNGAPHTGVDMLNDNGDLTVKAVRNGTLYRGAIACGGGTLRYVKVQQSDGYNTYYLHVDY